MVMSWNPNLCMKKYLLRYKSLNKSRYLKRLTINFLQKKNLVHKKNYKNWKEMRQKVWIYFKGSKNMPYP